MSDPDQTLRALAAAHGVHQGFHDLHGHHHATSIGTLRALLDALGVDYSDPDAALADAHTAPALPREMVLRAAHPSTLADMPDGPWTVLSDAGAIAAEGRSTGSIDLPALPVGYYHLHQNNLTSFLLVKPDRAPNLGDKTDSAACWGMTAALYGLRSETNGGLGNYQDLQQLATQLADKGASFLGVNPVHALGLGRPDIISPYSPSHRGFFNPDHLAITGGLGPTPDADLIDYPAFRKTQRKALANEFKTFLKSPERADFQAWCTGSSEALQRLAEFDVLTDLHGSDFRTWPTALRAPSSASTKAAGKDVQFHMWLQWMAERQIETAQSAALAGGMTLGLYLDLAVGPRTDGAEVWMNGDTIAQGITVGAPPDHLSPEGQSWALAAHAPRRLAAAHYRPLRHMLAKLMSRCGVLRIDHALGLSRSFWLPDDGHAGGYITQPFEHLLAVILIEAHKTGCVVVGEDLGLVPDGFRETMNAAGLYSYAVWQFEGRHDGTIAPAHTLAPQALACFSTHDTPTLRGYWHGLDIEWWSRVGWLDPQERADRHATRARQRTSLRDVCGLPASAEPTRCLDRIHAELATAPSQMVSVQLEDALGLSQAQNLPGTIDEHPNWQRRLPVPVAAMAQDKNLQNVVNLMQTNRPKPNKKAHS